MIDYTRMLKKQTDGSRMLLLVVFLIHHSLIFRCRCKKFPLNLFQFQLPSTIHLFFNFFKCIFLILLLSDLITYNTCTFYLSSFIFSFFVPSFSFPNFSLSSFSSGCYCYFYSSLFCTNDFSFYNQPANQFVDIFYII